MQDTASPSPQVPKPAAASDEAPALAFADAEGAKRWAKSLLITGVTPLFEAIHGQLRALSAADFAPRERATIAEVMRDQVAHLHTELARRYAGKPQPAADRERDAAEQALSLWQGLWEQYSSCLKPLLEGDAELQGVKAKLLQRGLYVGKQLIIVYGLARRVPPPALWQELHAYYRLAEMLDCAVTAVSDDLQPHAVGLSCYSTYCHALLMGLADPCAMSVRQIELTDRWLGQWARKVFPYPQQRETEGPVMLIDLDSAVGAWLANSAPRTSTASMRYCYPGKLATSVRGRLKRLASRRESRRAATWPRHFGRGFGIAAQASGRELVPARRPRRGSHASRTAAQRGRRDGGLLPRGWPHLRPPGSARSHDVSGRAAFANVGCVDRLRSLQGRSRAQLAVGTLARRLCLGERVAAAARPHAVSLVSRTAGRRAR